LIYELIEIELAGTGPPLTETGGAEVDAEPPPPQATSDNDKHIDVIYCFIYNPSSVNTVIIAPIL
jgi:hypothetical protein